MELRHSSKFERSLGRSVIENVLKSCANELALVTYLHTCQNGMNPFAFTHENVPYLPTYVCEFLTIMDILTCS
jgi:hypothetical protein